MGDSLIVMFIIDCVSSFLLCIAIILFCISMTIETVTMIKSRTMVIGIRIINYVLGIFFLCLSAYLLLHIWGLL